MTVPVVRQTAPWPLRRNAPGNFDQMADAVGASLPNTIDDINAFGAWMEERAAGTDTAKQAAEESAAAAAQSAVTAGQQAEAATTNGAAQVQLAEQARQAAEASAQTAGTYAAAAEAAGGANLALLHATALSF